ncbi:DUF1127 domain-containing protein [Rhizobium sp. P38BS-XIX]|uniref:DUF1127 domain-containing protein n=1 Tax=Rhizobium sp. P38BS-XIX TaxID=2726740 RepID=UPI0014570687|nr:DUF1127 domain-containing protein [Rhizobium sp. P38BS-XIX]NLR96094.1 DUF1127 domain-containing protein [Rhizobium sp. P38BS-XIX]
MAIDTERMAAVMPAAGRGASGSGLLKRSWAAFQSYLEKRRTRRDLRELTDSELVDIGVTRAEARIEISKSWFWS